MSDKLHNLHKYEQFKAKVYAEHIRSIVAKNLQQFESETEGLDYVALTDVPGWLGIENDELVFLLLRLFIPEPELFEDGLFLQCDALLTALHKFVEKPRPFAYTPIAFSDLLESAENE